MKLWSFSHCRLQWLPPLSSSLPSYYASFMVNRRRSRGWTRKMTKWSWCKAAMIHEQDVTFPLANGFMIKLILSTTQTAHILAQPSLARKMDGRILTTRSGNGSLKVVLFRGKCKRISCVSSTINRRLISKSGMHFLCTFPLQFAISFGINVA